MIEGFNLKEAFRSALGKCPNCNITATHGMWLKWCKKCGYISPLSRAQKIETIVEMNEYAREAEAALNALETPIAKSCESVPCPPEETVELKVKS